MERNKFNEILAALGRTIQELQAAKTGVILIKDGWQDHLWDRYEKTRRGFKAKTAKMPNQLFDRHKIGAVLAKVILEERPLLRNSSLPPTNKQRLANELLAYDAAIIVLWSYLVDEGENPLVNPRLRKLLVQGGILYPSCNHGSFRMNLVSAFAHCEILGNDQFSVFFLAKVLFLLEVTNLTAYKIKLFENGHPLPAA